MLKYVILFVILIVVVFVLIKLDSFLSTQYNETTLENQYNATFETTIENQHITDYNTTIKDQSKPLCTNNTHANGGNWELNIYKTDKTFVCCGGGIESMYYRDDHLDVKEGYCSNNSTVTHDPFVLQRGDTVYNTQCGDDCCICDREGNTRYNATERELYEWIPDQCYLVNFDAILFCTLLGDRKILFVGDSTMQQTASTLMSMITNGKALCAPQITFGWSTHLVHSKFHNNLKDYIERNDADIVILTSGAHLSDIGDIWSIFTTLENDIRLLRLNGMNTTLIWKTQNPGHVNCHLQHRPLRWDEHSPYENDTDKYDWKIFKQFDEVAREYTKVLNISLIDMSPLYYRPDGHVYGQKEDCLHYCQPGPLDLFSQLLLQKLYTNEI